MTSREHERDHLDSVWQFALEVLPADQIPDVEAQVGSCNDCRSDLETLRPVVNAFVAWPTDLLRPSKSLWERLARRISVESGQAMLAGPERSAEPAWEEAAPGIECKRLATDAASGRVTLLVRIAPGAEYPPHTHAGIEELHMLHGELMVDDRKLSAGDYLRSEPGTSDHRVWSETGCTGVLITSMRDALL